MQFLRINVCCFDGNIVRPTRAASLGSIEERLLNGSRGTATSYVEDNGGSTQAHIIDTWKTHHRYTTKLIG